MARVKVHQPDSTRFASKLRYLHGPLPYQLIELRVEAAMMRFLRRGPSELFLDIGESCCSAFGDSANNGQDLLGLFSGEGAMRVNGNDGTHDCTLRPGYAVVNDLTDKGSLLY